MEADLITLNIGGSVFKTRRATLKTFPHSKLGSLSPTSENYISEINEYFFDRSPDLFNVVLDFNRCQGVLHVPSYICGILLIREFEFWELPIQSISDCCFRIYTNHKKEEEVRRNMDRSREQHTEGMTSQHGQRSFQDKIWLFFDLPKSSRAAMVFFGIFMVMVVLSVMESMLRTRPSFRDPLPSPPQHNNLYNTTGQKGSNLTNGNIDTTDNNLSWKVQMYMKTTPKPALAFIGFITNAFFGLELFIHFLSCPQKKYFLKRYSNLIDIFVVFITILYYVVIALSRQFMMDKHFRYLFILSNVLMMFKMLRFFRLAKMYSELQVLLLAIRASMKELILLLVTFSIFMILFGNLIYYTELTESETFPDIFVGVWWAVVTMTTVGYGDTVPKSPAGYVTGAITSMSGLLIIAMPVAIIARNFDDYYNVYNDKMSKTKMAIVSKRNSVFPDTKSVTIQDLIKQDVEREKKLSVNQ